MDFAAGVERSVVLGDVHVLVASPEVLAVPLRLFVRLNGPGQRRSRRPARMVSLADCTSMILMQSASLRAILTGDEHFVMAGLAFELVDRLARASGG